MKKKYLFNRFKKPGKKKNKNYNNLFHLLRYLSYWISIPFIYLPFTPNQITFFANFLQVSSIIIIAYADGYFKFYGLLLYFIGGIFDFVDGNIARFKKKTSKKGIFYDQIGHVFVAPLFYIGIGVAAYNNNNDTFYLYITILMAMFVPIMSYQIGVSPKYFNKKSKKTSANQFITRSENKKTLFFIKKLVSGFYNYKIEFLFFAILFEILETLAIISAFYFVLRFFLQLYVDQKNIS